MYECICSKKYKYASGLSKHKKKCEIQQKQIEIIENNKHNLEPEQLEKVNKLFQTNAKENYLNGDIFKLIEQIIIQNTQLVEQNTKMVEQMKDITKEAKVINNYYTNNNNGTIKNTTFNTMNFLNNDCKDAINMSDFAQLFDYTFEDVEKLSEVGWLHNTTDILTNMLNELGDTKRPIHCSDKKRKKFYVKENDKWEIDMCYEMIYKLITIIHNRQCQEYIKWKQLVKDKINTNDDLQDKSMITNMELCKISTEESNGLKEKIITKLTNFTIPKL